VSSEGEGWGSAAAGGLWRGLIPGRSPLRVDCTSVLVRGARCRTHSARLRRAAFKQLHRVRLRSACPSARAAPRPARLRRPGNRPRHRPPAAARYAGVDQRGSGVRDAPGARHVPKAPPTVLSEGACGPGVVRLCSPEKRSTTGLHACRRTRVLRQLICRGCLSRVNEVNVASSAAGRLCEHRREVGAQRRPLQWRTTPGPQAPSRPGAHFAKQQPCTRLRVRPEPWQST